MLTGGSARPDIGPAFYEPTVLEGVTKDMLAGSCETFGPVVALHRYRTVDEAVALANDTDYGLNASVWGTDLAAAEAVARRIESGNVNVNDSLATAYASKGTPSGGVKQSGVGARHGDQGLLKYTDVQNVAVLKKQVLGARARPGLRSLRHADARRPQDDAEACLRRDPPESSSGGSSVTRPAGDRFDSPIQKPSMTWTPGSSGVGGGAEGDEQRRVVLDGRVGVGHARRLRLVRRQRVDVAAGHRLAGPRVEVGRPAGDRGVDPPVGEERQPVGRGSRTR